MRIVGCWKVSIIRITSELCFTIQIFSRDIELVINFLEISNSILIYIIQYFLVSVGINFGIVNFSIIKN